MNTENFNVYDGVEVAPPAVLRPIRNARLKQGVQDLPNEELADPYELERQVFRKEFDALLCLPKPKSGRCNPAWDTSVDIDFNAFACVDFQRMQPEFDKAKYKADKLREQLKDLLILIYIINDRISSKAKYKILKLVRTSVIEIDDISNWDMWLLSKYYMKAISLRNQIKKLQDASKRRREQRVQKWLDLLG